MKKRQRVVRVPRGYYRRVHETRYRRIFDAGAAFRQDRMSRFVVPAWEEFCAAAGLLKGMCGVEFGSGTGINTVALVEQGFRMVGLDISSTACQKASELSEARDLTVFFLVGDMFQLPFRDACFDFAVNVWTLHVVGEQPLRDRHLRECLRVLKSGAYLFLHNERSVEDVLDPDEDVMTIQTDEWNIGEHTQRMTKTNGGQVEVRFPGHMPEGLTGRRSLSEHRAELERAGFRVAHAYGDVMRPAPDVPGNPVMVAFAQKPT